MTTSPHPTPCPETTARRLVSELRLACRDAGVTTIVTAAVVRNAADLSLCVAFAEMSESAAERLEYLSLAALHCERVHADVETLSLRNASDRTHLASAAAMTAWLGPAVSLAMESVQSTATQETTK